MHAYVDMRDMYEGACAFIGTLTQGYRRYREPSCFHLHVRKTAERRLDHSSPPYHVATCETVDRQAHRLFLLFLDMSE